MRQRKGTSKSFGFCFRVEIEALLLVVPSEEYGALLWNFHRPLKPSKSHFIDPNTISKLSGTSVLTSGVDVTKALEAVDIAQAGPEYIQM